MNKTRMGKRVASLLLSLVMMLSLLPTAAYATMADGVDTQGASVSENGTGVSDDSNSSGDTGDLQVGDSEDGGTADDTTGAEGGADTTGAEGGNDTTGAENGTVTYVAYIGETGYETLDAAITAANDGDTITLGEGEFTTYGNTSPKKSLTFVGAGDKTVWIIGDLSKDVKSEGNGDCSFDGCDTITFQNMTLKSDGADYRGFIRISNTVVKKCTLVGKTAYWGYETAKFEDSTFNAPVGDYALWDYSTKAMTLEGCTFNISGKGVNVYVEQPSTDARTVEVNSCTVNSDKAGKAFLNIKNSTQAFDVTLSGTNTVTGLAADSTTGSALYQVETTKVTETAGNPVTVKEKADDGTVTTVYEVKQPSTSELTDYVTVSGIKGFENTKFATFAEAYAAIKPVVATLGLGQETPADAAAFDAVFTDISNGKATLTYTITGNVTYDETGLDHLLTMGRSSSHYLTNERHLINFKFVGAEADRGATLTVNSNITLPYEWWGEKITTSISFENLTITGSAPSGLFANQSFFEGIDFKVDNCTLKGIKIYNCANVGGSYTITNSKLDGTGAAKNAYAIHLQGNDTAPLNILIENNQISGYDRGVNIDQKTAIATISGNSISIKDSGRSCIQLTQLAKTTVSGNTMTLDGGNAITLHGNLAEGSKIEVTGNTITGTGYLIYDAAKVTIDLTYTDNTVSDTIDTTKGVYGGKEYEVSENVANALKPDTTTYVAEVKGVKYETLQAAIDAAKRNDTVTLLADTRENVTIPTNSANYLTLDLNGHTLNGGTVKGKPALTVTARVTVKDSSAAQTGTIKREDTAENSGVSSHYVIDIQDGWLFFESGNVTNNSGVVGVKGASLVRVGDDSIAKYPGLTISGGTFTQDNFIVIKVDRGTFYLKEDGTLNSKNSYAVENWKFAEIKGGTVNGTVAAWTYSGGHNSDLTISGGTVNGNVASVSYDKTEGKLAKVSISGGTVNGTLGTYTYGNGLIPINDAAKATIAVTGGTFSSDPTKYVVEDSGVTPNGDGTYGVAKAYLAKVGGTSYYTMDEAFKAQTASGEAIVLLRDYTTGSTFNSGTVARTVDLNGHTWTCTGTDANSAAFEINNPNATLIVKNGKVVSSQLVGLIPSAMGGTIKYDNSTLVFDGVEMTTTARSGIETNGNNTNDTVTLKNSTLNVPNGFGIYFPSSGTLTIENSKINAKTMGVQVCSGSLNITGDQTAITVSGDGIEKTGNDGAIEDGAAISIVERTGYKGLSEIKVSGGTFKANGTNDAVKAYKWENQTASSFTQAEKVSVSGGTFSSAVDKSLCAGGYIPTQNADGTYGVKEGADGYVEDENGNVTISTAEGLFYFAKKVNAGNNFAGKTVTLANNIDLKDELWTPIGVYGDKNNPAMPFKGTFDGQNHAVTGLKVEESRKNGVGFFGKVYTGTIKNLTVEGSVSAPGCTYVGGIVGHGYATITNCTFKGTVSGSGAAQVGGIAGSGGFTVDRCSVYGDVSAGCWAGGIVGNCQDGGAYTNCYVEGTISSESTYWGGGAAGITPVPLYPSQVISGCYSNTVVKVAGEEVNCPIIACYNNPLDLNGYSGGLKIYDNSWNKQKNSNDSYPIYAEKDGKGGVLMEGMTAARDNSLIMLEDDLNYVTGDLSKVRIMAGSSVTQAQIDALAVASVGDSKYQSLAEAINAAEDGQTVTMLADATEDVVISKSITLDLGGKTLTNTNAGKATISVQSGTVTVKNGNVVGGTDYYNIEVTKGSNANLTLTDVTATAGNTGSSMIDNWGTLTITSGDYSGGLNVVKSEEGSVLNISGGTFTRKTAPRWGITGTVLVYGTTTITGGTFNEKSTSTNARVVVTGRVDGYDSITYVKGGTFNGNGNSVFHHLSPAQADDSFEVSGGTFNKSIPDYYCTDGFIPTKNADGTYGVKEGHYVAQIGNKKYETLADAIRLAAKGKTITLLADVEQNTQLTINKNITLDLNGKTIKISGYTAEKAQVSVKGNLTIQDSSEAQTGKICSDYTGTAGRVVSVENGGKLTIAGGTITTEGMSGPSGSAVYIASGAEVNMTGGTVKVDAKRGNAAMNIRGSTGVFTMSGGSVIAEAGDGTETNITAISGISGSTIQISAGTVSGPQALFARSSATTITGGNFTGSITVKNGSISGGTFDRALDKKACAAGYVPTQNADGTYGVAVGKFTVMVTSRTTGSDSPVANVAGGGSDITYAAGTTVTASAISGYNFVGWFVNEYTGTPYSTDLTCEVKPTDDCTMIAVYEPISGGKFWLTVTASEFTVNGGAVQDSYLYEQFAVGASVTVNFTGSENFLYWVNASNKVVSTDKSYSFIMGSETTLKAVYGKARQNQATVVFISHSDQIISSKAYTTNDTIQFPVPPIKMGCTFTGWSMTEADIRAAMAQSNGIIEVRALYTNPSIACKVTVVYPEGTDDVVVNTVVGATVNVTAKDIEGKTFSYWTDNDGNILGYTKTLKLAPSGDMTVKAVYDQAAEAKPVITMSEVSATTANESYVVTFMATRAVPDGYKVVKQGILWSRDAVCGEDGAAAYMQFDSNGKLPNGVNAYIGNSSELNGVTRLDITTKYNDRTFYGRGYMVLESDAGELLYIYTDTIASGSYDSLTK